MALQDQTRLQQIGQALGGFSAGIEGNLPQYQVAQNQQRQMQIDQQKAQTEQQAQDEELRQEANMKDLQQAKYLVDNGMWDELFQLGFTRLENQSRIGVSDTSDTQELTTLSLGAIGNTGSQENIDEARKLLTKDVNTRYELAVARGDIDPPQQQNLSEMNQWISEGKGRDVEGFNKYKASIAKDAGYTNVARLEDGTWVGMRNGIMQEIPADESAIQQKPRTETPTSDPGSATGGERDSAGRLLENDPLAGLDLGKLALNLSSEDKERATDVLANQARALQKQRKDEGISLSYDEALSETLSKMIDKGWIKKDEGVIFNQAVLEIPPGESLFDKAYILTQEDIDSSPTLQGMGATPGRELVYIDGERVLR
jgi:hypothetical protein